MKHEREMPGPHLHRSILFWSGILVMSFVVWAWWDSLHNRSTCYVRSLRAANVDAGCQIFFGGSVPAGTWWGSLPRFGRDKVGARGQVETQLFPPLSLLHGGGARLDNDSGETENYFAELEAAKTPLDRLKAAMKLRPTTAWCLIIPHWLILLVVAGLWVALLAWRARRYRLRDGIGSMKDES